MIGKSKEEQLFPRGGVTKRKKSIRDEERFKKIKDDDLFSTKRNQDKSETKKVKRSTKKGSRVVVEDDPLAVKKIDALSYDDLSEGWTLLGFVSVIRDLELIITLPGKLTAIVPITQISTPYTNALKALTENQSSSDPAFEPRPLSSMFFIGQCVICTILSVSILDAEGSFHNVVASLDPQRVQGQKLDSRNLQGVKLVGAVKSFEDYGYMMDIGLPGIQAFLPKKKLEKYINDVLGGQAPSIGQLIPCVVTEVKGNTAKLSSEPKKIKFSLTLPEKVNVHSILPGFSFSGTVDEKPVAMGIRVKFGDFTGYAHHHNLPNPITSYEAGAPVTFHVLYQHPMVNTIFVSLKTNARLGEKQVDSFTHVKVGDIVSNATVTYSTNNGVTIRIKEGITGFIPNKKLSDDQGALKDLKRKFTSGVTVPSCRVFQYDYSSQVFHCSCQKSMLKEGSTLLLENLKPGDKLSGTIKKFIEIGVVVKINENISGVIPVLFLTDVPLKNPELKFKVGDKLKCRVLRVDPSCRKLLLTSKPILVNKEYEIVDSCSRENVGKITEGVVVQMTPNGILLQLFGNARGFVPKSKISTIEIDHPEKLFFLGQALKCRVTEADPEKERLILSLTLEDKKFKPLGVKEKAVADNLSMGKIYTVVVEGIASDGLNVATTFVKDEDSHLVESHYKSIKCFIPAQHLTDHPALASLLLDTYKVGDLINSAVCFEKGPVPILSMKPTIVEFAKTQPCKSFNDISEGTLLPCVVNLVKPYGVFLRMASWKFNKPALVPTRHLADFFVEHPRDVVQMYDTVYGKVIEKDAEKLAITMTTKVKLLHELGHSESVNLISTLFEDLSNIRKQFPNKKLANLALGAPVTCKIKEVNEFGLETSVAELRGIIPRANLNPSEVYQVGSTISAVVVFVDFQFSCLELSPDPAFVRQVVRNKEKSGPKEGDLVRGKVVLVRSAPLHFVSLAIQTPQRFVGQLIHLSTRQNLNDFAGSSEKFTVGDEHEVVVKKDGDYLIGVLKRDELLKKRQRQNSAVATRNLPEAKKLRLELPTPDPVPVEDSEEQEPLKDIVEIKVEDPGWEEDYNPWGISTGDSQTPNEDVSNQGDSSAGSKKKKTHLTKKEKKELDKLESEEIARAEQRVLDGEEAEPETADEFDRLVLSSPNSSLCWIKYMAFYISKNDHEKARQVATKALEKIHFREEAERLNVYLAWFNMEHTCKNDEAAEKVYKEALKCNDQFSVYQRVASIYSQNEDQYEKAESIYKLMARKYCKEPEVWSQLGQFYFKIGNLKDARFTLQRSLQNLEMKHHVDISSKFAQMEFKHGEAERGKTIFENIVNNYPKRTDQWNVYVDMVIKKGDFDAAREIFERMTLLNLQLKRMTAFFKKYLKFEQTHGEPHKADQVRKKALSYIEALKSGSVDIDAEDELELD